MTEDDEKLLKATLDGIPKDWEKVWPRYDQRHWMQNLATVLSVEQGELHARHALRLRRVAPLLPRCSPPPLTAKGTPIYNLFMSLVSDACYRILPGEEERIRKHCKEQLKMSDAQIDALPRKYFRKHCRYSCPPPEDIIRNLFEIYAFFRSLPDPRKRDRHTCLTSDHARIFKKEIAYVRKGLLSDPPKMEMYRLVGRTKMGLERFRCLRTTSALEAHFLHYSRSLHATAKSSGPKALNMRTTYFDFAWTLRAAEAAGRMKPIGHNQPWMIDQLCVLEAWCGSQRASVRGVSTLRPHPPHPSPQARHLRGLDAGVEVAGNSRGG